jgi:uncharacterized protein YprB with RNaseH-like and TPR domain
MRDDLRQRLRELGVVRGVGELAAQPPRPAVAIEDIVEGSFHTTSRGKCFVARESLGCDHVHGDLPLSAFLELPAEAVAQVGLDERLVDLGLRRFCFLDTETTGLSAGSGTMAFIVGIGFFVSDGFELRQFFLRDPGDEPAMVEALEELFPGFEALVSFNGRAFDVPIIENRLILARVTPTLRHMPHLDLLHPARRLWRYALSSCALTSLEREVLGVRRELADVPSGLIPYLYRDYLRTGDARDMKRVLYHNKIDILSMVTLAVCLCRAYADPWHAGQFAQGQAPSVGELYALGRWYASEGRVEEAERAYRAAVRLPFGDNWGTRGWTLRELALLLKRDERRDEAFAFWQQLALESRKDAVQEAAGVLAHVELAKYFEWTVGDLERAAAWTGAGLKRVMDGMRGMQRDRKEADLRHRLARLERKMAAAWVDGTGSPGSEARA